MPDGVVAVSVGRGFSTVFALVSDGVCGLVDAGLYGSSNRILDELGARGVPDPAWVFVTHSHLDHVGGLAQLRRRTEIPVLAHALEAPLIDGSRRPPQYTDRGLGRVLRYTERFLPYEPVSVDADLVDGDSLPFPEDLEVVHLPGHTAGHCGVWWPSRRTLLAGDAIMGFFGRLVVGWPMDVQDPVLARASADRIVDLEPQTVYLSHGGRLSSAEIARLTDAREGRLRALLRPVPG